MFVGLHNRSYATLGSISRWGLSQPYYSLPLRPRSPSILDLSLSEAGMGLEADWKEYDVGLTSQ